MTEPDCEMLRDRMPDVARGTARWSAAEATHLTACADCRAEWVLVRAALPLGARVEAEFDAAGAARAVSARLRRAATIRWPAPRYLVGLAAAAALALVVVRPVQSPAAGPAAAETRFLPELDSLTLDELTRVAEGLETPLTETELIEGQPLFELDATQLERVLRSMEG